MEGESVMFENNIFAKYKLMPVRAGTQVYNIIRSAIMKGELKAGESLVVMHLATFLKTSRTPVREAIQRLEAEGWVERQINGKVVVAEVSLKQLKDYYAVRAVLEGLATQEATLVMTDEELRNIEKEYSNFSIIASNNDTPKIVSAGEKLHSLIHKAAKNEVCKQILDGINDQLIRYRVYTASVPGRNKEVIEEHLKILKFMRERRADEAAVAMQEHVMRAGEKFVEQVKNELEKRDSNSPQ